MTKYSFLLALCFLLSIRLIAQKTITGTVTDTKGKTLSNVKITVKNTKLKTFSTEAGTYIIIVPDEYTKLNFEHPDYNEQEVKIEDYKIDVALTKLSEILSLSLEELMSLKVVSASRNIQKITEAPSTITVITKEMIRNRGYEDIGDVLRDLPGVDLQNYNGYFGTVFAQRGMMGDENKRTIIMVNGISDNQLWGSEIFTGQLLPLHNVEQIEIIWGPASALYGANAFNGIINVITTPNETKEKTFVTFGGGSFETTTGRFRTYQPIGKNTCLSIAASIYDSEGPTFKNHIDPDYSNAFVDQSTALDFQLKHKNTLLYFRNFHLAEGIGNFVASPYKYLHDFRNVSMPDSLKNIGFGNTIQSEIYGETGLRYVIEGTTIGLKKDFELFNDLNVKFQSYYRTTDLMPDHWDYVYKIRTRPNKDNPTVSDTSYFDKINSWHTSYNHGLEIYGVLSKKRAVTTAGIQLDYTNTQTDYIKRIYTFFNHIPELFQPPIDVRRVAFRNIGLSLQTVLRIKNNHQLTAGVRFDANNNYENQINPRIGFVSKITEKLTAKLLYGTAFRAPTARELYSTGIGKAGRVANPDLKPERLQSFESGVFYNVNSFLFNELNAFYNMAHDVIVASVPISDNRTQNQNRTEMTVYGAEYKAVIEPVKSIKIFGNISYQMGKQTVFVKKTDDTYDPVITDRDNLAHYEIDIPNIANWKWNAGFNYQAVKFINLNLMVNGVGRRSTIYTNPLRSIDGYIRANFTALIRIHSSTNLTLQLRNILDTEYYDPGARTANFKVFTPKIEQAGRALYAKLELSF